MTKQSESIWDKPCKDNIYHSMTVQVIEKDGIRVNKFKCPKCGQIITRKNDD